MFALINAVQLRQETAGVLHKSCITPKATSVQMGAGASSSSKGPAAASRATPLSSLNPPSAAQFARAISDASQRNDDAFMRKIFNRHATKEKLSASALIAALKDVAAPVLATASSEGSCDTADHIFRRADANMSGDVDYSE